MAMKLGNLSNKAIIIKPTIIVANLVAANVVPHMMALNIPETTAEELAILQMKQMKPKHPN